MLENVLLLLVQAKLADGRLPRDRADRVWGGHGQGQICDACDEPIYKDELGMERPGSGGVEAFFFHLKCFAVWDRERVRA